MINFIVVDDIDFYRKLIKNIIVEFSIKTDEEVNIHIFDNYNCDFKRMARLKLENKFYILDIETPRHNGICEAKQIRKNDIESPILFSSMYEKSYSGELLRSNIKFGFVSKLESIGFERALFYEIMYLYNEIIYLPKLTLNSSNSLSNVPYRSISYIESTNGEINIKTRNGKVPIKTPLLKLEKELPTYFFQCHRSCIVNLKNVVHIGKKIILDDGSEITKISKYRKKELIKRYKKEQDFD